MSIVASMDAQEVLGAHWDLYIPFLLRAYQLTKQRGRFSYIIPNPFSREKYATEIRGFLLRNTRIRHILSFGEENVFDEVSRQTLVPVFVKEQPDLGSEVIRIDALETTMRQARTVREVPQRVFHELPGYQIRHEVDPIQFAILDKVDSLSIRLGNLCYVNYGAQVSSKEKGEYSKSDVVSDSAGQDGKPFFEGKDLQRYQVMSRGLYLDYRPSTMYGPRDPVLFESPKLVFRKISGEADSLVVALDREGLYCDDGLVLGVWYDAVSGTRLC